MPNTLLDTYVGGEGFTGLAIQVDTSVNPVVGNQATPVDPTEFPPGMNNTLWPTVARDEASVQANTIYADQIDEPGYITVAGNHEWFFNTKVGNLYWFGALGGKTTIAAVSAVTTAGSVTANGRTTHTITGAFLPGTPVRVNTGAAMEGAIVLSYSAGTLVTTECKKAGNGTAASGMTIAQPPLGKAARSLMPAANLNMLPLLTVVKNMGGDWEGWFSNVTVEGIEFEISTGLVRGTAHLFGNTYPQWLDATTSPTKHSYTPNSSDQAQALKPFTAMNGILAFGDDPAASGASAVRAAFGARLVRYNLANNLIKAEIIGNDIVQAFPSDGATLEITWDVLDTGHRAALLEDYIRVSGGASFYSGLAKNLGSAGSPNLQMQTFYSPYVKPRTSGHTDAIGALGTFNNGGRAHVVPGGVQDLVQVFWSTD